MKHEVRQGGRSHATDSVVEWLRAGTYSVTSVERIGSSLKPRFRQAVLRFPKVAPEARTIELVVKDVAGVEERVFRWKLTE